MKEKVMPDTSGKLRMHVEVECTYCRKLFWRPKRFLDRHKRAYCSPKCAHAAQQQRVVVTCYHCGKSFTRTQTKLKGSRSGFYFCSRGCKDASQRVENNGHNWNPRYVKNTGRYTYRTIAWRNYPHKCACCDYAEHEEGLEVHHIDGNRRNNKLENLIILCALCHRLVTNGVYTIIDRKMVKNTEELKSLTRCLDAYDKITGRGTA